MANVLTIALILSILSGVYPTSREVHNSLCPKIVQKVFKGYVPRGNMSAGVFTEVPNEKHKKSCILDCCIKEECNVAFMTNEKCYHIKCKTDEGCLPKFLNKDSVGSISMVLVKPVESDVWSDLLEDQGDVLLEPRTGSMYSSYSHKDQLENDYKNFLQMEESTYSYGDGCEVGVQESCAVNEECLPNNAKSRAGTCKCKTGYFRSLEGDCDAPESFSEKNGQNLTNTVTRAQLHVIAESKTIRLPESEVSLTATVSPSSVDEKNAQYQYDWTALTQPEGSSAVKHQNGETLQLTKLSEGLYTFKIVVSNEHAYGENFVNVTVLAPSRENRPPQIVITPANQTIKLPNTGAVLDASSSTDDDGIVSFHWELQQGPVGYQPQLNDTPTLQLNDLKLPGNYTFKLTVTDSDKETSVSTANITVLKITDYPPEANAGQDTIIYLPHNRITLNGNQSIDDHMITTWEWTKSPDDAEKAVDMQDTRTPYLRLSDLEEGMYTFSLKVTDSANQSSTAQVHVFVKPPTNKPPVANAGHNVTISLPQTWVEVDASNSTDDNKIEAFRWEQVDGPSTVTFGDVNATKTNVTGLTKGAYTFKISVTDDNGNIATDVVHIMVDQNKNQKPTANAGEDLVVELPRNAVYVNGSKSSDDWAIVRWRWTREDASLALGAIAEGSDDTPVLIVTDLRTGRYIFNLTVYDEQGLSDSDIVTVTVKNDPKLYFLVDMVVDADAEQLTESQYDILKGKLTLLIQADTKLQIRSVKEQAGTGRPIITLYVESADGTAVPANSVVHHLREKLRMDAGLLGFSISGLQTTVCQNNCSGHGVCNEKSRKCVCEAFWMEDLFKLYMSDNGEDSNCSWSILYVALGIICFVLAIVGSAWGIVYLCINGCSKRSSKPTTYKLIEDADDMPPYSNRKADLSDSDTDSDVVFESRSKSNRFNGDLRNGHKGARNGFSKIGRRVKTKRRSILFTRT